MLAIIPARGGSVGLPGKNIKLLNGKPLIAYTIECALSSSLISRVIVSTDSKEIADVALKYGAEVPYLRPAELASGTANAFDAYKHLLNWLKEKEGYETSNCIILQPTSPLRISEDIDNAIKLFEFKKADSVISFTPEDHPISWHKKIDTSGKINEIWAKEKAKNRQEYEQTYYPNGALFIYKTEMIINKNQFSENSYAYLMPKERSIDIDTQLDFDFAQFLMNQV